METARTEALERIYGDIALAWESEPTYEVRRPARDHWGRLIATSATRP